MIKLVHIVLQIVASAIMRGIKTKSHLNVSYFGLTEYKYCVKGNIHSHFIFNLFAVANSKHFFSELC